VLLGDGASRLVDLFELATWEELLALLDESGPDELLRQVRAAEAVDPEGRPRIVACDAPGCGQSSEPPETWRMPDYADCLAAWLKVVGAERPHVLGLSWGSSVALKLYRRHPQVPASLILASAYAGWAGSLPPEEVNARLAGVLDTFPFRMPQADQAQGVLFALSATMFCRSPRSSSTRS
jgi:pimeloyl-ACP methyl ester carboxylesterase